jgi:hypothetical protein
MFQQCESAELPLFEPSNNISSALSSLERIRSPSIPRLQTCPPSVLLPDIATISDVTLLGIANLN